MRSLRIPKRSYSLLIMLVAPLLALALPGVGWGLITNFVEIDGLVRFSSTVGTCEGGSDAGCPCSIATGVCSTSGVACSSGVCAAFDWANGPASAGVCSAPTVGVPISCPGMDGLFDGGVFNGAKEAPSPPTYIGSDPTIPAGGVAFGVDALGISTADAHACNTGTSFGNSCGTDADCGGVPGSCILCGTGDPTVYTGQGSETNNDALGGMTFNTATVPNKDDIDNVYAIAHLDPFPPTGASTDISEVYSAFERTINNGDSHVDLEFLQDTITLSAPCKGHLVGQRSAGDLLFSVEFTKGGVSGSPTLRTWLCDPTGLAGNTQGKCVGGTNDGSACTFLADCPQGRCGCDPIPAGKTTPAYSAPTTIGGALGTPAFNATQSVSCGGWTCRNPDGTPALRCVNPGGKNDGLACTTNGAACTDGGICQLALGFNEFYELGVNLKAAGFAGCINSFLPHTRSSQQFTATLKDFALLRFVTCQSAVTVTKSCTCAPNSTGDTIKVDISGQVCNPSTSSESVTLTSLTNDQPGTTFAGQCAPGTTALAPGDCCDYTGTYSESSTCTPTDSVTATVKGAVSGVTKTKTSDPAVCSCGTRGITVDKKCDCAVNNAGTGINVSFSGQVCNTGDLALSGVSLTDDQGGVTTPPSSTLAPGTCSPYSGSYASTAANPCSNSDTVTVNGGSAICPQALTPATKAASCTCAVTPRISVTKCCTNALVPDGAGHAVAMVSYSGQVCAKDSGGNSNVQLTGVTLSDDKGGVTTPPSSTLAPGACSSFSGSYFPTDLTCSATDTVTVSGSGICSTSPPPATASDTCTLCTDKTCLPPP